MWGKYFFWLFAMIGKKFVLAHFNKMNRRFRKIIKHIYAKHATSNAIEDSFEKMEIVTLVIIGKWRTGNKFYTADEYDQYNLNEFFHRY